MRQPGYRSNKRRFNSKVHIVLDVKGRVITLKIIARTTADCSVTLDLIKKIKLDTLLGDPAYDTNSIINYAKKLGIKSAIPPKSNRKFKRKFDSALYHLRYIVKNTFLKFNRWRGISARFSKLLLPSVLLFLFVLFPCLLLLFNFFVIIYFFLKLFSLKKILFAT